jgi:hypothetical protein
MPNKEMQKNCEYCIWFVELQDSCFGRCDCSKSSNFGCKVAAEVESREIINLEFCEFYSKYIDVSEIEPMSPDEFVSLISNKNAKYDAMFCALLRNLIDATENFSDIEDKYRYLDNLLPKELPRKLIMQLII